MAPSLTKEIVMKKTLLTLVAIPTLVLGTMAYADGGKHRDSCDGKHDRQSHGKKEHGMRDGQSGERMLKRMTKRLELTEEQQTSLKTVFEAQSKQRDALKEKSRDLHEALRDLDPKADGYAEQLEEAKKTAAQLAVERIDEGAELRQKVADILTPEQLEKWETEKERRGKGDERPPRPEKQS
jgi:Spy/CpxP family protein refolding chaperone